MTSSPEAERGSVLILVTVATMALLGFLAFTLDIGLFYLERTRLSAAVDAAALAGAMELPVDPLAAEETAVSYATINGAPSERVETRVTANQSKLFVQATEQVRFFIAPLWGKTGSTVAAGAQAQVYAVNGIVGAAPLSIEDHDLQKGVLYTLKESAGTFISSLGSGNYGILALGGDGGASRYEENLRDGYKSLLRTGELVLTQTGNISGSTRKALEDRFTDCRYPGCSYDQYGKGCKHIIYIPIYRLVGELANQVKQVKITGFAAFYVVAIAGSGINSEVRGYFVEATVNGIPDPNQHDYGLKAVRLVR